MHYAERAEEISMASEGGMHDEYSTLDRVQREKFQ